MVRTRRQTGPGIKQGDRCIQEMFDCHYSPPPNWGRAARPSPSACESAPRRAAAGRRGAQEPSASARDSARYERTLKITFVRLITLS